MNELISFDKTIYLDYYVPISTIQNETAILSKSHDECDEQIKDTFSEVSEQVVRMFDNLGNAKVSFGDYYNDDYTINNFGLDIEYKYEFSDKNYLDIRYKIMIPQELYDENSYKVKTEIRSEVRTIMQMATFSNLSQIYNEHIFKPLFFKLFELQKLRRKYNKALGKLEIKKKQPQTLVPQTGVLYCLYFKQKMHSYAPEIYNQMCTYPFHSTSSSLKDLSLSSSCWDLTYSNCLGYGTVYFFITKVLKNTIHVEFPNMLYDGISHTIMEIANIFTNIGTCLNKEEMSAKISLDDFKNLLNTTIHTNIKPVNSILMTYYKDILLNKCNYKYLFLPQQKENVCNTQYVLTKKGEDYRNGEYPKI